jgi:hypothetical protein
LIPKQILLISFPQYPSKNKAKNPRAALELLPILMPAMKVLLTLRAKAIIPMTGCPKVVRVVGSEFAFLRVHIFVSKTNMA